MKVVDKVVVKEEIIVKEEVVVRVPTSCPPQEQGLVGYPEPVIRDPYNQMLGFDLDNDTMVMYVSTFGGPTGLSANQSAVFAYTATEIVNHATSTGCSKIVIDVSANIVGDILRGFDLFKLFFPDGLHYSATRFRRSNTTESLAQAGPYVDATNSTSWPFLFKDQVTPDQEFGFDSVNGLLGNKKELSVEVQVSLCQHQLHVLCLRERPHSRIWSHRRSSQQDNALRA